MKSSDSLMERATLFLLARRRSVLLLAAAVFVLTAARTGLTYSDLRSDLEQLLPENAPSVQALSTLRARLPGVRHLGVVVDTGEAKNTAAANRFVDDLARRIEAYPKDLVGAVRVDVKGERAFAETYALQLVEPADIAELTSAVEKRRDHQVTRAMDLDLLDEEEDPPPELPLKKLRAKYEGKHGKAKTFPDDRFVAEDGSTVVLLVQASSHATGYASDKALLSRVQADIAALGFPASYDNGMRVGFAGDVATRVEEMEGLAADLGLAGLLVLLLVAGVILLYFRSARALPLLGIPLLMGTAAAFAIAALPPWSVTYLNSNTAFLGSIVVGNGINSGIILLARFREERRAGSALEAAIQDAVRGSWRPTLAAALAAGAAYGSLVVTDFRGFNQFGWIGLIGMLTCWLITFSVMPPLLSLWGEGLATPAPPSQAQATPPWVVRFPKAVVLSTLALSVVAGYGLSLRSHDWMEHDFSKLRRKDSWVNGERYWGARMDQTLGRYLTPTVVMAKDAESAKRIEARLREVQANEGAGGLIASVRSMRTALPDTRGKAVQEAARLKKVLTPKLLSELSAEDRALVEGALSPAALVPLKPEQVPDTLVMGLRENDGRMDRNVLVYPRIGAGTWEADRIDAFATDVRAAAASVTPEADVAGSLLLSSDIARAMKSDGPRATALSLVLVLVIGVLSFRSLGLSLLAVLSLSFGVLLMLGAVAWAGQKLNFSNFVALPITFGIAADYSINMLKRFQAEGESGLSSALAKTGGAVALCSATTIIGFGSLLVAQNQALFSFGVLATAGELTCLLTAIWALPALLAISSGRAPRAKPATQRS